MKILEYVLPHLVHGEDVYSTIIYKYLRNTDLYEQHRGTQEEDRWGLSIEDNKRALHR
jgi:hypothetical protein